ncbi:MAG: hypothetical protein EBR30_05200 [Cytophagia bacterium]|nr:hypothetical protein [Cytophagia bacterium]
MNLPQPYKIFEIKSKQLKVQSFQSPDLVIAQYFDLKDVTPQEYINYLEQCGDQMKEISTGRILSDFSNLKNFSLPLRAIALNHLPKAIIEKVPFLLIAVVKSQSSFENMSTQIALNTAKTLSKKVDGKMFDTLEQAYEWVTAYSIPLQTKL